MPLDVDITNESAPYVLRRLAETEALWAQGATLYAAGGLFDTQRKIALDKRCESWREFAAKVGTKVTETSITQQAHADPIYGLFVEQGAREREAWLLLDAQRQRWTLTLSILGHGSAQVKVLSWQRE